ncbi:hypothetical protein ACWEQ2_31735 [Streptomyces sp. NPDC004096]
MWISDGVVTGTPVGASPVMGSARYRLRLHMAAAQKINAPLDSIA